MIFYHIKKSNASGFLTNNAAAHTMKCKSGDRMNELIRLCDLQINKTAVVAEFCAGKMTQRINDLGIVEGSEITLIALRRKDSRKILVRCEDDI